MTGKTSHILKSMVHRLKSLLTNSSREEMLGELLVNKGIISENRLQVAFERQKQVLHESGKVVPLGLIIVEQENIAEEDIIDVVNDHYDLSVSSLSDNIRVLVGKIRANLPEEVPSPRIPIWLQLSVATMIVLAVSISVLSYVIMERQRDQLYDQTVKLGTVSLNYIADNAKVPLLNDDTLSLNTLINNVASVEGHYYALILNNEGMIKAHTNHAQIDKVYTPFTGAESQFRKGQVSYFNYTLPGKGHVLNLSMPILFQGKKLGEVHVGLSIDFIHNLFINERAFLACVALAIIFVGMVVAVLFSLRFSRPVSTLVEATSEIAKGNYNFKVDLKRDDELGTLGEAFNRMGSELYRQSIMRESFGKYVGPEVLDMIMKNPGESWLKGRKNRASVLFADIRGFTAYSEGKEPEEVVEKLNQFFAIATEVILEHGGYIDKFIGDSVLAVFGVPVYRQNHTRRCVMAAIDMQERLARASQDGNPLLDRVGIGIVSGVVVAGNIGSQVKMEYTVIGDSVNVASYLSNLAGPGEVVVGGSSEKELTDFIDVEPMEPQKIKGREELVQAYRLLGTKNNDLEDPTG